MCGTYSSFGSVAVVHGEEGIVGYGWLGAGQQAVDGQLYVILLLLLFLLLLH